MYLSSLLTVFRNVDYFRKFFAVKYHSEKTGKMQSMIDLIVAEDSKYDTEAVCLIFFILIPT